MVPLRNVAMLVLVLVVAASLQCTEAEDYTVGVDDIGWTSFPPGGASFYSTWAANLTFKVNDSLVFNFESGSHSVAVLTEDNYDKCNINDNIRNYATGPARLTLDRTGKFYFSCTFSGHCSSGQKLSVTVTASSTPSTETPSPPSPSNEEAPSSTTRQGETAPPPQGSAKPLAASFSLLLTTIAFNFLFQF